MQQAKFNGRDVVLKPYALPKRAAAGKIKIDGKEADVWITGGRGRGVVNHRYFYVLIGKTSMYAEFIGQENPVGGTLDLAKADAKPAKTEAKTTKA